MTENEHADRLGLGANDAHACCQGCGADWAADEDCATGCPGSREHCGDCGGLWPEAYGDRWLCLACKPGATAADRMRQGAA